jgi:hypothetical protein
VKVTLNPARRAVLFRLGAGVAILPLALLRSGPARADEPLSEEDPKAKEVGYVEDVARAKGAKVGASCTSCALYSGAKGSVSGPCQLFPGKLVKAGGWCSSWSDM